MSGATRFISTSERTRVLCTGLSLFGAFTDSAKSDPEFKTKEAAWDAWVDTWGMDMASIVQLTHNNLFDRASRF